MRIFTRRNPFGALVKQSIDFGSKLIEFRSLPRFLPTCMWFLLLALAPVFFFPAFSYAHDPGGGTVTPTPGSTTVLSDLGDTVDSISGAETLTELKGILDTIYSQIAAVLAAYPDSTESIQANARIRLYEYMGSILSNVNQKTLEIATSSDTSGELKTILGSTGDIVQSIQTLNLFLNHDMILDGISTATTAYGAGLDDLLGPRGVSTGNISTLLSNTDAAQSFFTDNTGALGAVGNHVLLPSAPQWVPPEGYGALVPQTVDMTKPVWAPEPADKGFAANPEEETTGLTIFQEVWPGIISTSEVLTDGTGGAVVVNNQSANGSVASISRMGPVTDFLPDGIHDLPDGTRFGVSSGVGFFAAPAARDFAELTTTLQAFGGSLTFSEDGRFSLKSAASYSICLGFGWTLSKSNKFSAGTAAFSISGSDPASAAYALLVTYSDATVQKAPPMPLALDALLAILDAYFPELYVFNRNTGVLDLDLLGLGKFKADWVFEHLENNYDAQAAAGTPLGELAVELGNFNGDNLIDFRLYSPLPKGRQIFYGVSDS